MDKINAERRSENMRRIKSKDSIPEMTVRRAVHKMGFRYRLHRKDLPGKPDLVLPKSKKVIFVHGCFWHCHDDPDCLDGRMPKSRPEYWGPKLSRNKVRDAERLAALHSLGWSPLVIWECETKDSSHLKRKLATFLNRKTSHKSGTQGASCGKLA